MMREPGKKKDKRQEMKENEKNWRCKSQIGYNLLSDHRCVLKYLQVIHPVNMLCNSNSQSIRPIGVVCEDMY